MDKFTVKLYKKSYDYEICQYPYSDTWPYLKITGYHKGKYADETTVDLYEINPEFSEFQAPKISLVRLTLYCIGTVLFVFVLLVILLAMFFEKNIISAASALAVPIGVVWYFVFCILEIRKNNLISEFVFDNKDSGVFSIPYERGKRLEALEIAEKIAAHCNHDLVEPNEHEIIRHQFNNGLAELRDEEIVLFNKDGIKCNYCDYASVVPGTHHYVEKHYIRNFFSISFAALFWLGTLLLIYSIIRSTKDWVMVFACGILFVIPFILGCISLSKYKKFQNYYYAGNRVNENEDWGIYLEVGKNPGSEKAFIDELNSRLRKAYSDCK